MTRPQILHSSKLKEFADDNIKFDEENTVGKGAISPFPTVFSKGLFPRDVKRRHCVGMGQIAAKNPMQATAIYYKYHHQIIKLELSLKVADTASPFLQLLAQ